MLAWFILQVETLKECGGGECIPDLRISVTDTLIKYVDCTRKVWLKAKNTVSLEPG